MKIAKNEQIENLFKLLSGSQVQFAALDLGISFCIFLTIMTMESHSIYRGPETTQEIEIDEQRKPMFENLCIAHVGNNN